MAESQNEQATASSPTKATAVTSDAEKTGGLSPKSHAFTDLRAPEELELDDHDGVENTQLLSSSSEKQQEEKITSFKASIFWMVVNTLATIAIVFTNKAIFSDPSLRLAQLTFAAFHFFITWLTLFILSRPRFALFQARKVAIKDIAPLAITMALNVILPNFSLAFSTVTFYQVARILLTPVTAIMNFVLYKSTLPRNAILALIPACLGVGMVSYYDSLPSKDAKIKTTSMLGVIFAFSGIFASSLYTVWIASYHKKLQMNSMQLLFNQAPLAAFMLLYVIPFVDTFPVWTQVPMNRYGLILLSGLCACVINMSQFFIIAQTGPVSSTVVGHMKTCSIVALGWMQSGRTVGDKAVIGVLVAIGGIITYSIVMINHKCQQKV